MGKFTSFSLIVPYYNQPEMLQRQVDNWNNWDDAIRERVNIIIVDDCSKHKEAIRKPLDHADPNLKIELYRILTDLPWNWIAARNLGARMASERSWLLLTDIDHLVDNKLITYLVKKMQYNRDAFYNFYRVDGPEHKPNPKPHPNSYFMTKDLFWKIGGYDEHYSGHYGTDGIWRRRCEAVAERKWIPEEYPLIQYLPEHCPDAMADLPRKSPEQADAVRKITENHPSYIKTLSFPWERIL